MTDILQH